MKSRLIAFFVFSLLISCAGSEENNENTDTTNELLPEADYDALSAGIKDFETRLALVEAPSEELLKEGISKYQEFAGYFPEDVNSADYLLKASDFCLNVKQPEKAVKILNRIIEDYPDYNRMEDVLFNKASHLDFELRDTTLAKATYQEFIAKYPDSELVDDAESRIQNIRFSMEEMVQQFILNMEAEGK